MATQITASNLTQITHNSIPVLTSDLLAQLYGTDVNNIQQNHKRNSDRFIEGKHFFKAVGEELKTLRLTISQSQISPKTRSLILWTERGAARHAKMLETDQAWEVFERLEDSYFSQREVTPAPPAPDVAMRWMLSFDKEGNQKIVPIPRNAWVMNIEEFIQEISGPGGAFIDDATLASLIVAATQELHQRAASYWKKLQH